jgi:hypothetical protein
MCIKDFSMKEDAKVVTYEYAWRNWAEHERVLKNRVFSISWEFNPMEWQTSPSAWYNTVQLVKKLRLTNNNKPWVLVHPTLGSFTCIMSNLSISQSWENYFQSSVTNWKIILDESYTFSFELLEHTPPSWKSLNDTNNLLCPKATVQVMTNPYLKYKNSSELYNAIKDNKIQPWIDVNINKEWIQYPTSMKQQAYDLWKAGWFVKNNPSTNISTVKTPVKKKHTVKVWESLIKIAKKYKVSHPDLLKENRNIIKKPTDKIIWLKIIIPSSPLSSWIWSLNK